MSAHLGLRATYAGNHFAFAAAQLYPRECHNPIFKGGYDHYAAIYNDLVIFGPYIDQPLAALKHAQHDARTFTTTAEVLVARLRAAANPLSTLLASGIGKSALASVAGLGWDWESMHWVIVFLLEQQAMARSVHAQLPDSVAALLICLLEVTELVGLTSQYMIQDVVAPAVEVLQAVIRDQSFEEDRSAFCVAASNDITTACDQDSSGKIMQATVLDRSFEEARSEQYAVRNVGATQPPIPVAKRVQPGVRGFAPPKLTVPLAQSSEVSVSGNPPAPATASFKLAATQPVFCSPISGTSLAPPKLAPTISQPSAVAPTLANADPKTNNMFANLGTHFKSDKSSNLFVDSRPKPAPPLQAAKKVEEPSNTPQKTIPASDTVKKVKPALDTSVMPTPVITPVSTIAASSSKNLPAPSTITASSTEGKAHASPTATSSTGKTLPPSSGHTSTSSTLPNPKAFTSNQDIIVGLTHPTLKKDFEFKTKILKGKLNQEQVPNEKELRPLFLVPECVLEHRKAEWFDAKMVAEGKGVEEMHEAIGFLKTDIEFIYGVEKIREQPVLMSLCKALGAAERVLDAEEDSKEKGWAFLKIKSGLGVLKDR